MVSVASLRVGIVAISEFAPAKGHKMKMHDWENSISEDRVHILK